MRVGIWIGMIGWMALGCGVPSDPEPSRDWKEAQNQGVNGFLKADGTADPLEFPVRLAQVDLTGTWPEGSVENLLSSSLSEASGGSGEKEWKGRLREGLSLH